MSKAIAPSSSRGQGFGVKGGNAAITKALLNQTGRVGSSTIQASFDGNSDVDVGAIAQELLKTGARRSTTAKGFTVRQAKKSETADSEEASTEDEELLAEPEAEQEEPATDEPEGKESTEAEAEEESVTLSVDALTKFTESIEASHGERDRLRSELDSTKKELEEARVALSQSQEEQSVQQKEVEASRSAVEVLDRLSKLTGVDVNNPTARSVRNQQSQSAHINRLTNPLAKGPSGAYGKFVRAFDSAETRYVMLGSRRQLVRDTRGYDAIARQNLREVRRGLEKEMQDAGLLRGEMNTGTLSASGSLAKASTTIADVAGNFLPRISSLQRLRNTQTYVFRNWIYHEFAFGRNAGNSMRFMRRASLIPKPKRTEDRLLSGGNVFVPISTNTTPVQTNYKEFKIKGWGLGRADVGDPVGITAFVEMYSLGSLLQTLNDCLYDDYLCWEDRDIRAVFQRTSRVAWNKNGTLVDSTTNLSAGDGGTLTVDFIVAAAMYMETLGVPSIDGYYVLIIPSTSLRSLIADIDGKLELGNEKQRQIVRDVIESHAGDDVQGISSNLDSGVVGVIANVIVVRSNAYGTGQPGSDGVQSETIAGSTLTTRSCYMFGAGTVVKGVGMPYEIRSDMSPFDREERMIWTEHSTGAQGLDIDSLNSPDAGNSGEDTRCIELRVTDASF